jgi:hypothetical protein
MSLYLRRQFAARVNDFVKGNAGANLHIAMPPGTVSPMEACLTAPLGDESYLSFKAILQPYGLSFAGQKERDVLVFYRAKNVIDPHNAVTVPWQVFVSTFDVELKRNVPGIVGRL